MTDKNENDQRSYLEIVIQIEMYYVPTLVYLGSLGNFISILIFFRSKLKQSSSSVYLGALAISDTGFLISLFISWLTGVNVNLFNKPGFCEFFVYFTTLCSFLSVWLVVAFTVERFIAVKYPLLRQSMCTVARAKNFVVKIIITGVITCSPVMMFAGLREGKSENGKNSTICHLTEGWESWATIYTMIDTVITFIIPFFVIVLLNILITKTIYKLDGIRKTLTLQKRSQTIQNGFGQTKVTKMLLVVSSVFLCFNLPSYVLRLLSFIQVRIQ